MIVRNGKKVFTKPRHDSSKGNTKGGGRSKTDQESFGCGRVGHIRADCRATTDVNGGPPKSAPRGKGVRNCEEEEQGFSQDVPLGIIDLGLLKYCQITATAWKTILLLMNPQKNSQVPGSRGQGQQGTQTGSFCNIAMATAAEESPFFDCWDWRCGQSDTLQQTDTSAQNVPTSISSAKGCLSVNFPHCSVCQKLGVHSQHLPITAPSPPPPPPSSQYDIPSEGECRPDEVPLEVAPV